MRVDKVVMPANPAEMPWCKLSVLNAGKGMRRKTEMHTGNFGSDLVTAFLRPRLIEADSPEVAAGRDPTG